MKPKERSTDVWMRNGLLFLLLLNILVFMWGMLQGDEPEPGVEIVDESDLGPPLAVAAEPQPELVASVGAVLESVEPSELTGSVGRACVTIGPFRSADDADDAELRYAGDGMQVARRSPLELPAEISPRFSEGTIHFVDLALPPGRGAGEIVERYGEEMVMLRDEATCPE